MSRNVEALTAVLDNIRGELLKKVKERKARRGQPAPETTKEIETATSDEEE